MQPFIDAVRRGDTDALRAMSANADVREVVNRPIFDFDSPAIVHVAGRGDIALVNALLELGADPNSRSQWWAGGFHALYSASPAVAQRLLEAGAVPDACAAAHMNRIDLLRDMLDRDPSRVNERGGDGQTPLHFARSRAVVDVLLDAGAEIDARDIDHRSTAAEWMLGDSRDPGRSRLQLSRYLVDRGAHADIFLAAALGLVQRATDLLTGDRSLLDLRTGHGLYGEVPPSSYHIYQWTIGGNVSPLQAAARFGQHDTARAMMKFASPMQQLQFFATSGNRDQALSIARSNPDAASEMRSRDRSALAEAALTANADSVRVLLELGFDPAEHSGDSPAGTALHCAAWVGSTECVQLLLQHPGARDLLEMRDPTYGGTPLSWCCHGSLNHRRSGADHAGVARALVDAGADRSQAGDCSDEVAAVVRP